MTGEKKDLGGGGIWGKGGGLLMLGHPAPHSTKVMNEPPAEGTPPSTSRELRCVTIILRQVQGYRGWE